MSPFSKSSFRTGDRTKSINVWRCMEIMLGERTRHFARFLNFQDIVLYLPFCNPPPTGKGGERVVNFSISLVHQRIFGKSYGFSLNWSAKTLTGSRRNELRHIQWEWRNLQMWESEDVVKMFRYNSSIQCTTHTRTVQIQCWISLKEHPLGVFMARGADPEKTKASFSSAPADFWFELLCLLCDFTSLGAPQGHEHPSGRNVWILPENFINWKTFFIAYRSSYDDDDDFLFHFWLLPGV